MKRVNRMLLWLCLLCFTQWASAAAFVWLQGRDADASFLSRYDVKSASDMTIDVTSPNRLIVYVQSAADLKKAKHLLKQGKATGLAFSEQMADKEKAKAFWQIIQSVPKPKAGKSPIFISILVGTMQDDGFYLDQQRTDAVQETILLSPHKGKVQVEVAFANGSINRAFSRSDQTQNLPMSSIVAYGDKKTLTPQALQHLHDHGVVHLTQISGAYSDAAKDRYKHIVPIGMVVEAVILPPNKYVLHGDRADHPVSRLYSTAQKIQAPLLRQK